MAILSCILSCWGILSCSKDLSCLVQSDGYLVLFNRINKTKINQKKHGANPLFHQSNCDSLFNFKKIGTHKKIRTELNKKEIKQIVVDERLVQGAGKLVILDRSLYLCVS